MTATAIRSAGILPDLRLNRRIALRRELVAADGLEAGAARWREHADELAALVRSRPPRALSVDLLPTVQRLRLNGAPPWVPKVLHAVKPVAPAPVVDPVVAYMAQPDVHDVPVWSRLRDRAGDAVLALVARVVVPRPVTASPTVQEINRRRKLLAPLATPGPRRKSHRARLQAWAVDWAEWLKPSPGTLYEVRRAGS